MTEGVNVTRQFETAEGFLRENGRDIDVAWLDHHFGVAPHNELIEVLAHYQNSDGGFGRSLQPDIAAPDFNPFATEIASWSASDPLSGARNRGSGGWL